MGRDPGLRVPTPALIAATHVVGLPQQLDAACADLVALKPAKLAAYDAAVTSGVRATMEATRRDYEFLLQACADCARAQAHKALLA